MVITAVTYSVGVRDRALATWYCRGWWVVDSFVVNALNDGSVLGTQFVGGGGMAEKCQANEMPNMDSGCQNGQGYPVIHK